jgi:hypothetical protein
MIMSSTPWDRIDKTVEVHPSQVHEYVKRGWIVLMTYNVRDDVHESSWARGYQEQTVRSEYRPVVLMGQTILDSLEEEVGVLRIDKADLGKLRVDHDALKKEHEETKKRAAEHAREAREASERWDKCFQMRSETEALNRKLEGDISKIRAAIGELKMREILDGKKE